MHQPAADPCELRAVRLHSQLPRHSERYKLREGESRQEQETRRRQYGLQDGGIVLASGDPDTKVSPRRKCLDGNRTPGKTSGARAVPRPPGPSVSQTTTRARARRHQTVRAGRDRSAGPGRVGGRRTRGLGGLEPSRLAPGGRRAGAAGCRDDGYRTPPARAPGRCRHGEAARGLCEIETSTRRRRASEGTRSRTERWCGGASREG